MALITFGTNITDARGSAGGSVYSRNKGGAYIRARTVPINPRSLKQQTVRNNFGANAKLWSGTMTGAQRAAWIAFAAANPLVNILGASIIVSGLAMSQKLNQRLAQMGIAAIVAPPANLNVVGIVVPTALAAVHGAGSVTLTTAAQPAPAGTSYYVFGAPPMSAGKKATSSAYRYLATVAPTAAAVSITVGTAYTAAFGSFLANQNINLIVAQINIATGAVTPGLPFSAIAT